MFDVERDTRAVLSFLHDTKVGQMVTLPPRGEERDRRRTGGAGTPQENVSFLCLFFCSFLLLFFRGHFGSRR